MRQHLYSVCPYRHCFPPRWRMAAGGCCVAAAWRRACGGEERVRLAGCALSAPLPSPWTLSGPGWMRKRLCEDTPRMRTKYMQITTRGENSVLKRVLLLVGQGAESRTDREDPEDLQCVVQFEAVPVLVHLPTT